MAHEANTPPVLFRLGQAVPWPGAPDGYGQVEELLRSNVIVLYARSGRLCRAKVAARDLARVCEATPLLPGTPDNPFRRGIVRPRVKRFDAAAAPQPVRRLRPGKESSV